MLTVIDTIHWSFAFLLILCAALLGWVQLGRRLMVALFGIQFVIGVVYLGMLGAGVAALGGRLWLHILGWLLAMSAYIVGRRLGEGTRNRTVPIVLSALGLVLLLLTGYLGLMMHGRIGG